MNFTRLSFSKFKNPLSLSHFNLHFIGLEHHSVRWALTGAFLSLGAPVGLWILLKFVSPHTDSVMRIVYFYSAVATCIVFSLFGYAAGFLIQKIENLSFHDNLTNLFNRHYFLKRFDELLALSRRYSQPISLFMLDLDHFKQVNDCFGHAVGDQALKAVANVILNECRQTDIPARYGGEEFIIVCPNTDQEEAYRLAERIRLVVKSLPSDILGFPGFQTISIGVTSIRGDHQMDGDALIKKADQAMYQAKNEGRNRVVTMI